MSIKELLAVLSDEVADAAVPLGHALEALRGGDPEQEAYQQAFERYSEQVARVAEVAGMLELTGLGQLCESVMENLAALPGEPPESPLFELLGGWPKLLAAYLRHPHRNEEGEGLLGWFSRPEWPFPLEPAQVEALREQMRGDLVQAEGAMREQQPQRVRPEEAGPQDMVLEFAQDVSVQLRESFLIEAPGHASRYSQVIQAVAAGRGDASTLDEARRVIHTLKGAANTLGVRGIANLCHHTEDILQYLVQSGGLLPHPLGALLVRVADQLEAMVGCLLGEEEPPAGGLALLREVLVWARRIDEGEEIAGMGEGAPSPEETPAVEGASLPEPPEREAARPQSSVTLPVAASVLDGLVRLAGEITLAQRQVQGQLGWLEERLRELLEQHRLLRQRTQVLEDLVDIQGVSAGVDARRKGIARESAAAEGVFDSLEMDRYNELHSHTHAFVESFADVQVGIEEFHATLGAAQSRLAEQARINAELHRGLLDARLAPAGQLSGRLQRALRNTCHLTGKEARLEILGEEVMLDSLVISALAEPLLHLLRNAVDHGLESAEERRRTGKAAEGRVQVVFAREGNKAVIRCRDDGRGLDLPRIREQALARGLIPAAAELSPAELARLVLMPGFSTARELTQVSGRGVGMDVVNAAIGRLKGSIEIESLPGQGASFILRLPITLASVDALLAQAGEDAVAIPVDDVIQVVYAGCRNLRLQGSQWRYLDGEGEEMGEGGIHVALLSDLLGFPNPNGLGIPGDERPLLLVRSGTGERRALVADRLLDTQELVMKRAGKYLSQLPGVIGVSILGDGRVISVIDIAHLLDRPPGVDAITELRAAGRAAEVEEQGDVLVVDDSLSVRQSLTQLLADAGFGVRAARDGFEAIEAINRRIPAALLVDLEMPRMNGLELTEHVRGQPATKDIPIIMITSRSQEKHRQRAQQAGVDAYLTKPYQEQELLGLLQRRLRAVYETGLHTGEGETDGR